MDGLIYTAPEEKRPANAKGSPWEKLVKWFTHTETALLQNMEGIKVYTCTDTELKQTLAYCCLMVGIDKPPGDDKKMIMVSFLRKYYGSLTTRQIAQAFELVANGELGDRLQEHYNTISPMYLSNVLRAYLHKAEGVKNRFEARKKEEAQPPKSTPEEYYNRLLKVIEGYNVIPLLWAWEEVHLHLCKTNGGDFSKATTPEEKKAAVIKHLKEKYPEAGMQSVG